MSNQNGNGNTALSILTIVCIIAASPITWLTVWALGKAEISIPVFGIEFSSVNPYMVGIIVSILVLIIVSQSKGK